MFCSVVLIGSPPTLPQLGKACWSYTCYPCSGSGIRCFFDTWPWNRDQEYVSSGPRSWIPISDPVSRSLIPDSGSNQELGNQFWVYKVREFLHFLSIDSDLSLYLFNKYQLSEVYGYPLVCLVKFELEWFFLSLTIVGLLFVGSGIWDGKKKHTGCSS